MSWRGAIAAVTALFVAIAATGLLLVTALFGGSKLFASDCHSPAGITSLEPHNVVIDPRGLTVQGKPMTQEQADNAEIVLGTIAAHKLDSTPATEIALITIIVESWILNLDWGDASSLGLYQQITDWGSAQERRNPVIATEMFLFGGRKGQPGLTDIDGWQAMPAGKAAQAVQRSAHPDRYAKWLLEARAIIRQASSATSAVRLISHEDPTGTAFAPETRITDSTCISTGPDGFTFPIAATTEVIKQGVRHGSDKVAWNYRATKNYHHHYMAADVHVEPGMTVLAAMPGRVLRVTDTDVGCKNPGHPRLKYDVPRITVLDESTGLHWYYTHMQPGTLAVEVGQTIAAGTPIGKVGHAGCAQNTAPHLHIHASRGPIRSTENPADRAKMIDVQPLLVAAFNAGGKLSGESSQAVVPPLANLRVTSEFGRRLHPIHKTWKLHDGIDFGAPHGEPVRAIAGGKVVSVGAQGGYGERVVLEHQLNGTTVRTQYSHLSGYADIGSTVRSGQTIGYIGSTGTATGPHLHFTTWVNGELVNPRQFFKANNVSF